MSKILIVAEHDGAKLNPSTHKCVTCAAKIPGASVDVLVLAADSAAVASQAAAIAGVGKVIAVDDAANKEPIAAVLAPQVAKLAADYTHVFGPSTTFGKDLMPRVAALLGVGQVSDIMAVEGAHSFKRPIYAGNAVLTVEVPADAKVVATVRVASFEAAAMGGGASVVKADPGVAVPTHTRFVSRSGATTGRPDLQTAARVVAGGRALGSADGFKIIYSFADKIGAAVGASRAAVDAGYVPNDLQIGQTGKIIAPELYFAIGISGAIQHMTGIKDARTIVAINKDGEAPIFESADVGIVGDLFAIVPELEKALG
ncbi:MAG: electron transfer flavoprotein subunit alpha/FixB family protein [Gammaproteobacteria bacterium]|nr:electron transfer flavoprotein subunit alpha/FixB family protein [Gammaproteobacteria bacterium]